MIDGTGDLLGVTFERGNNLSRIFVEHYRILICTTCNERGNTQMGKGGRETERESERECMSEELHTGNISHQSKPSMSLQRDPKPRFQVHLHYANPKLTKTYIIRLRTRAS